MMLTKDSRSSYRGGEFGTHSIVKNLVKHMKEIAYRYSAKNERSRILILYVVAGNFFFHDWA